MAARGKYQRKLNRLYDSIIMRQPNTGESGIGTLSGSGATGCGSGSGTSGSGATCSSASGSGATASAASQMIDDIIAKWPNGRM